MDVDRAGVVTRLREPVARRKRWVVSCARADADSVGGVGNGTNLRGRVPELEGDSAANRNRAREGQCQVVNHRHAVLPTA
jgi:hypothetical protein